MIAVSNSAVDLSAQTLWNMFWSLSKFILLVLHGTSTLLKLMQRLPRLIESRFSYKELYENPLTSSMEDLRIRGNISIRKYVYDNQVIALSANVLTFSVNSHL
jgi:hypothetical protein